MLPLATRRRMIGTASVSCHDCRHTGCPAGASPRRNGACRFGVGADADRRERADDFLAGRGRQTTRHRSQRPRSNGSSRRSPSKRIAAYAARRTRSSHAARDSGSIERLLMPLAALTNKLTAMSSVRTGSFRHASEVPLVAENLPVAGLAFEQPATPIGIDDRTAAMGTDRGAVGVGPPHTAEHLVRRVF